MKRLGITSALLLLMAVLSISGLDHQEQKNAGKHTITPTSYEIAKHTITPSVIYDGYIVKHTITPKSFKI